MRTIASSLAGKALRGSTRQRESTARGPAVCHRIHDTHVHSGHRASHRLIRRRAAAYFGQPFLRDQVAATGHARGGDPRYARPNEAGRAQYLALNATHGRTS